MADHRAAEHRMRQTVADIAHLAQHDVRPGARTGTHEQGGYQAMHKNWYQNGSTKNAIGHFRGDAPGFLLGHVVGQGAVGDKRHGT